MMQELNVSAGGRTKEHRRSARQTGMRYFINWDREAQLEAFFAWLPKEVHHLPGMDWTCLSPRIMGYCVRAIRNSPDAVTLAVVAAALHGAIDVVSQRTQLQEMHSLLQSLRVICHIQHVDDLKHERIWYEWATQQKTASTTARQRLNAYASFVAGHFPRYLQRLDGVDRQYMQRYALPPFPLNLREKHFPMRQLRAAQRIKRKAQTDILTPLYPLLRQLVRLRKQLAERMLLAFRNARSRACAGEVELPYHFQYLEAI